jgi:prepilin-type N-terminal cleavage/methylation domain-containing protein
MTNQIRNPNDETNARTLGGIRFEFRHSNLIRHSDFGFRISRPGFTLIELLVVIGIILILIGLFFAGAKIVTAQAKTRDTQTALETCKTMFENYKQATHLTRPPPSGFGSVVSPPGTSLQTTFSTSNASPTGSLTTPLFWTAGEEAAPGALSSDASAYTGGSYPQAVTNTAFVMYALESIADNQKIITNLPPSKIINVTISLENNQVVSVPLIRDGWGNPILFVPGGGLGATPGNGANQVLSPGVVWLDGLTYGIKTSTGVITSTSTNPTFSLYDAANTTQFPIGSTSQPFFVSAGPDGDVSNAHGNTSTTPTSDMTDDNVYSFNN